MAADLRSEFLLDPSVTFLNHGSFGACPRPVFERYQHWQLELERQPVEFLGLRSLPLKPGDEIVTTDHEYGACDLAWQFLHERNGVIVHRAPIALPVASKTEIVDAIWNRVTERTKVIYLSHITS